MKTVFKSNAMYWIVVLLGSCLLLGGWSVAIKNLINGTTVVS
jgi:hypothetical protein